MLLQLHAVGLLFCAQIGESLRTLEILVMEKMKALIRSISDLERMVCAHAALPVDLFGHVCTNRTTGRAA